MKKILIFILLAIACSFAQTNYTYASTAMCSGNQCTPATNQIPGFASLMIYGDKGIVGISAGNFSDAISFRNPRVSYNHGIEIITCDAVDRNGNPGLYISTARGIMFTNGNNTLMFYDSNDPSGLYPYFNMITH